MGLRRGSKTTGRFPGASDKLFVARCRKFFLHQLAAQEPVVVLALGKWVPEFIAPLAPQLAAWHVLKGFIDRDNVGCSLVERVKFKGLRHECVVVSLLHPSLRRANLRLRRWKGLVGDAAEQKLVRDALRLARLA